MAVRVAAGTGTAGECRGAGRVASTWRAGSGRENHPRQPGDRLGLGAVDAAGSRSEEHRCGLPTRGLPRGSYEARLSARPDRSSRCIERRQLAHRGSPPADPTASRPHPQRERRSTTNLETASPTEESRRMRR